jgi:predicted DNA-binding protein
LQTQMIIRIDAETKRKADALARHEGKSISQVIRELLDDYIRERDAGAYIDDLWNRIGTQLSSSGRSQKDVRKAVSVVRKGK